MGATKLAKSKKSNKSFKKLMGMNKARKCQRIRHIS